MRQYGGMMQGAGGDPRRQLGLEIRRVVDRSPLLKKQAARSIGVSPAMLSNWFAGRALPSRDQLEAVIAFGERTAGVTDFGPPPVDPSVLRDTWVRARALPDIQPVASEELRDALIEFFGADAESVGVTMVYPEFTVLEGSLVPKNGAEVHSDLAKYPSRVSGSRLGGFGPVVSAHDIGAAAMVTDLLGAYGIRVRLGVDATVTKQGGQLPVVAFGLQTNALTAYYLRKGLRVQPLFSAVSEDVPQVVFEDGTSYFSEPPVWRGVVARITPRPKERPDRRWFFCAGLGGIGTAIAANYLCSEWQSLHREVGSADFAVVVSGHEMSPALAQRDALYVR